MRSEYDERLGDYEIHIWGKPVSKVSLGKENGYLCGFDAASGRKFWRYTPFAPGLLFGADGETLDLTGEIPTAQNIQLIRTG